ncbi:MAG: hypothetical protein PVF74_01375 [Anaerolineales bacterium]|jgi:heme-degrading monooxygenase HmoA
MIHFIALFPKSIDPEVLDKYISDLAGSYEGVPGFHSLHVSDGDLMSPAGPPSYSRVLEVAFDSLEDFMGWVQSPWAQSPQAQADKNFMIANGVIMLFYEVNEI